MRTGPVHLMDQLHRHLLRLPAGGAVADGDVLHAVLPDQLRQHGNGLVLLPLAVGGIHHRGIQHLAGAVHHRHLAAHAIAGVKAHGDLSLHRRLHQQRLQVQGKLADGALVGLLRQQIPHLPLQRGIDQPVVGVLAGRLDEFHGGGAGLHHGTAHQRQRRVTVQQHGDREEALLFAPVDGQYLMPGQPGQRLLEVVIQPVDAVRLHGGQTAETALPRQQAPQSLADIRVVGKHLGHDVVGALQGVRRRLHTLLRVDIVLRRQFRRRTIFLLGQQQQRQRLQPLLPRRRGTGAALLLIGTVEILHLRQRSGTVDGGGQLLRQLPLLLDGLLHRLPALGQIPQVLEPFLQRAQSGVIHGAVQLLAVAGDKGDGISLIQQADNVFHMLRVFIKLLCNGLNNIHRNFLFGIE